MTELFGPSVPANLIDPEHGFAEWWEAWPRGPRKVARKQCLAKWVRYKCSENAGFITAHVEQMKRSKDWTKDEGQYTPAPLVYLNQARWEGETLESLDTTSRRAIEEMGVKVGIGRWDEIREQFSGYRSRILSLWNKEKAGGWLKELGK